MTILDVKSWVPYNDVLIHFKRDLFEVPAYSYQLPGLTM